MESRITGYLRIVLLGKTGSGKSATGNTILGRIAFEEDINPESVTQECEKQDTTNGNRNILIVDTPGLQDPSVHERKVEEEIEKCLEMSAPGPHVFLLVVRADARFTKEEKDAVEWIQENFGKEAVRHTIVLFAHADKLKNKPLEDHIQECDDVLEFVRSCGGRYHAFNNVNRQNQDQVTKLLEKMDKLVESNYGNYYINAYMYKQAQKKHNWWKTGFVVCGLSVIVVVVVITLKKGKALKE